MEGRYAASFGADPLKQESSDLKRMAEKKLHMKTIQCRIK